MDLTSFQLKDLQEMDQPMSEEKFNDAKEELWDSDVESSSCSPSCSPSHSEGELPEDCSSDEDSDSCPDLRELWQPSMWWELSDKDQYGSYSMEGTGELGDVTKGFIDYYRLDKLRFWLTEEGDDSSTGEDINEEGKKKSGGKRRKTGGGSGAKAANSMMKEGTTPEVGEDIN